MRNHLRIIGADYRSSGNIGTVDVVILSGRFSEAGAIAIIPAVSGFSKAR